MLFERFQAAKISFAIFLHELLTQVTDIFMFVGPSILDSGLPHTLICPCAKDMISTTVLVTVCIISLYFSNSNFQIY